MNEDEQFSDDQIENEHLKEYIEKKIKKNSRLRVGRKNKNIKKSRRQRMFKTVLPLLLFFIMIALISGYFVSPFSKVKSVKVETPQLKKQIKHDLPIHVGDSLLMINSNETKINDALQQSDINFKKVKISWKNHNEAIVKVYFYNFYAYVERNGKYYAANPRGEIKQQASKVNHTKNDVILHGFSNDKQVQTTLTQYEKLPNDLKSDVKSINNVANADDPQKVKILLNDKNQVILKDSKLAKKMSYYPGIKTTLRRPSIINMEYGAYATPIK